ncbi:MAG: gliding motility protein GldL [Bacteroidales bacterium]|nr:gliding motility protein GldL [Bacteroidales bacterium]MDD3431849.1 gliding motility protein GldL [Bacteroidales bacterium]MDD4362292.1 gliding motility protein GldL [Bacteroidales bacterium]MDD4430440.1 gliding motility protein GldL [Bacteroidales bacterium]
MSDKQQKQREESRLAAFLGSQRGKTIFNFFYGFGASLAILGTLFKLLHLDGANTMLAIGLGTEVLIFALSAFEPPFRNYRWEEVFPVLKSRKAEDRPDFNNLGLGGGVIIQGGTGQATSVQNGGTGQASASPGDTAQARAYQGPARGAAPFADITPQQAAQSFGIPPQVQLSPEDSEVLADSIKRMGEAVRQLNALANITNVTEDYLQQLAGMTENLNRFSRATGSLAEVSNVLLDSYKNITENSDQITNNSKGYVEQMDALNLNLQGLNTIYGIQLKSISSQIDTIDRVNKGLLHIKEMYEGSALDSERFRTETQQMADHLANLNQFYARMLNAMIPGNNPMMGMAYMANQGPQAKQENTAEETPKAADNSADKDLQDENNKENNQQ